MNIRKLIQSYDPTAPLGEAWTIPSSWYLDPEVGELERKTVFSRSWHFAGRSEQVERPGQYVTCDIANEPVVIVRGTDGVLRGFFNVCRHHAAAVMTDSCGEASQLQCPYHGWTYALDGHLLGAPHMQELNFCREDYPLNRVHADLWDGHLFLNLSANPEPLSHQLASLPQKFASWRMQDLRRQKRIIYEVKANWKLIVLNYNECLHCPVLHPCLNRLTNYLGADNEPPHRNYIGGSMGFRDGDRH